MVNRILFFIAFILLLGNSPALSQVSPSYTMFFINPYQINSSYAGIEGRPFFNLNHRRQWVGIDGAPVTTNFTFHMPIKYGVSVGAEFYSDQRSILNTNAFTFTVGYAVSLSPKSILRFGLSGGAGSRNIDLEQVDNTSDPAIRDALDNSFYLDGNFGLSFQTGYFFLGIALPNFFEPNLNNYSNFENGTFAPLNEILFNASYRFYFALDEMFFEPSVVYRYNQVMPSQYEVAGIFSLKNLIWFGGSYRQDYGVSGIVGLTINKRLLIGYSFGIGSQSLPGIGANTHEFSLSLALGQRKQPSGSSAPDFFVSYVDTERFFPDPRVKRQKASEEIAKAKTPEPIIVEVEPDVEEDTGALEENGLHDDPRLVMSRPKRLASSSIIRSETVYAGNSDFELPRGNYIVIGEFASEQDARRLTDRLGNEGYRAEYGYVSRKRQWIVYIYRSDSRIGFRKKVLETRDNPDFMNAWILSVL